MLCQIMFGRTNKYEYLRIAGRGPMLISIITMAKQKLILFRQIQTNDSDVRKIKQEQKVTPTNNDTYVANFDGNFYDFKKFLWHDE